MVYWLFLAMAVTTSVIGQTLLKAGAGLSHRPGSVAGGFVAQVLDVRTLSGLLLYGVAALLYIVALRRIPLSVALPCTAASYIAAVLIGHFVYDEVLTPMHIAAVAVIGCGVVMLALAAR